MVMIHIVKLYKYIEKQLSNSLGEYSSKSRIFKKYLYLAIYNQMVKNQVQHQQGRKYFALIDRVGSWHKYQVIIGVIMTLINIFEASLIFVVPYLLNQVSYTCPNITGDKCTEYVCRLNQSDRKAYLTTKPPFSSLVDQLGNFRCERSGQLVMVQSWVFIGAVIGLFSFSFFTQKFGRKNSLLLALSLTLLGTVLIFFSTNLVILSIGFFLTYAGIQNAYQYTYCYSTEVVAEEHRITFINICSIAYGFGIMLNSFTFYGLKDWRIAFSMFYILPLFLTIIAIIYYIEKTPVDLLATQSPEQIMKALERIANMNGIDLHGLKKEELQIIKEEYHLESKGKFYTIIDVFCFKSLLKIALPLIAINFLCNFLFYAPSFIMKSANIDLYRDNIMSGISFIISCLVAQVVLLFFPRKPSSYINNAFTALFAGLLLVQGVQQSPLLKPTIYFLFRLSASVYLNLVYLLDFQSFPTQIRATAASFCYIFAETAGTVQPQLIAFFQSNKINLNLVFMVVALLSCLATIPSKQTFGIPPPQIIQQLQHHEHQLAKEHTSKVQNDNQFI